VLLVHHTHSMSRAIADRIFMIISIIIATAAALIGVVAGYFIRRMIATSRLSDAEQRAQRALQEAREQEKSIILSAKEKAITIIDEGKQEAEQRRKEVEHTQKRLESRESLFDKRLLEIEEKQQTLAERAKKIEEAKEQIRALQQQQIDKLEKIAGLTVEQAKEVLMRNTEERSKEEFAARLQKLQLVESEEWEKQAKGILTTVMERCASSHAAESATTNLHLPSDELKGRIIGREGRNIKTIENLTGVEIIVDETPETIIISGFSPIRRHLAKRVLEKLISDGRIHPGRIEEVVEMIKKELSADIQKAGLEAAREAGVAGLDPRLLKIMGRLKFRTSYGQNVLRHSIEVAHLSAMLAEELGANAAVARKGGFLHDIGKAVDHEVQGTHMEIGRDICKKFGLSDEIIAPVYEHHDDRPSTIEGIIVKTADALSGARIGARKDTHENYVQRLQELEDVATQFDGIERAYALQAGREIRVFAMPDRLDDTASQQLARDIAAEIEKTLKYPGEIKVNLIRERRFIEYAR
jgi:ribonuclease Y